MSAALERVAGPGSLLNASPQVVEAEAGTRRHRETPRLSVVIGAVAVGFSALYLLSDLIELAQGGFSTGQLALTYAAEAAIPLFVLGLFAVQRPRIGALGLIGAATYAYAYVFFTSTVVYALVNRTHDWNELTAQLGGWIAVHSVLMVLAGVVFGAAVIRADVLPRWTGVTLIAGMVLMAITASLPAATQMMAAAVRDVAFAGMGAALLGRTNRPSVSESKPESVPDRPTVAGTGASR